MIGVARDAKYDRLRGDAPATIYVPYTQRPFGWPQEMTFELRTVGNTADAVAGIRRAIAEIDRMLPITDVKTQEAQIDDSIAQEHLFASLVSLFSAFTLALACVGIYGSVAYTVTRRTRELGVRMALGANRMAVLRMLLGQVALTVGAGLAIGMPANLDADARHRIATLRGQAARPGQHSDGSGRSRGRGDSGGASARAAGHAHRPGARASVPMTLSGSLGGDSRGGCVDEQR